MAKTVLLAEFPNYVCIIPAYFLPSIATLDSCRRLKVKRKMVYCAKGTTTPVRIFA